MLPGELKSHPVYEELDGVLTAPVEGTCYTSGVWKKYDYFIVHPALRFHIARVDVDGMADTAPHLPVRLKLLSTVPGLVQRVPQQPKTLPHEFPQGCTRRSACLSKMGRPACQC